MHGANTLSTQESFSGTSQTMAVVETASTAIAAQAKAMIESRYIMAMRNPRNWDQVRADILKECSRPSFANNKSAYYKKPIGNGVEGLGIRFVEVALRCMKNVLIESTMIFEDDDKEIHRVSVTDLESNVTYPLDVKVTKTVERSKPSDDGSFISVRNNSNGYKTYTVVAKDDDMLNKRGAMISKAIRNLGLRVLPGDICDEAEAIIKQVRINKASEDPDSERKKLVDAFATIGVNATSLVEYLGHPIDQCSPSQLVDLRGIFGAINDGESSWKSVMDNKDELANDGGHNLTADELINKINSAKTVDEFNGLKKFVKKFKDGDREKIVTAWNEKMTKFDNQDLLAQIEQCKSAEELTELVNTMSEADQLKYSDEIDAQYDSFR